MARKANVNYDKENGILYVYSGEKVKDSLEMDNFVVDFSVDDKIVGIEIFNAVEVINNLTSLKLNESDMSNIQSAYFKFWPGKELVYRFVSLYIL